MKSRISGSRLIAAVSVATVGLALSACGGSGSQGGEGEVNLSNVEFVLPSSPGGSTDLIGRSLAQNLEEPLDATVTTVNRAGANSAIGTKAVVRGTPNGESIVLVPETLMAVTPLTIDDPDAVELDEMRIVAGISVEDYVLVVNAEENSAETLEELLDQSGLSYGTAGVGTGGQLSQALLLGEAGVDYVSVPMDGGAGTVNGLLGGQIDAASMSIAEAAPHIESGAFRPIVTFGSERPEFLDEVPTAEEEGYDVVVDQKRFIAMPAEVDEEVVNVYADAIEDARQVEAYQNFLTENYISEWEIEAEEIPSSIEGTRAKYEEQLDELGITLQE